MVTTKQIENMQHAIGIREDRIKRKKYEAFRNYYTTSNPHESWEDLVKKEYAVSEKFERGIGDNPMCYFVTRKGLDLLQEIMFIKITEME